MFHSSVALTLAEALLGAMSTLAGVWLKSLNYAKEKGHSMRLTFMAIKNCMGIDEHGVHIDFASITLLFGPNKAGKSIIMQALHRAQEVLCHPLADYDSVDITRQGPGWVHLKTMGTNTVLTVMDALVLKWRWTACP